MAWLASLDARAARWFPPLRWLYLSLKYLLIVLGAYALIGLGVQGLMQKRPNLGVAFLVYLVYEGISRAPALLRRLYARGNR